MYKLLVLFVLITLLGLFGCATKSSRQQTLAPVNQTTQMFGAFNDKRYIWTEYQFNVNSNSVK